MLFFHCFFLHFYSHVYRKSSFNVFIYSVFILPGRSIKNQAKGQQSETSIAASGKIKNK